MVPGVVVYLQNLHHHSSWVQGGFSGLINGLIAAAFGAPSMLMSERTVKSNVKRTCMFVLSIATIHYTYTQGATAQRF